MSTSQTVHVIDDDVAMRDSLAFILEVNGFQVVVHETADAFLAAPAAAEGCCIVTDIRMPGTSGLELVRQLNARDDRYAVIVMTGHGDVPLAVEAMKGGALDFIEKPFADDILLRAVRGALDRRPVQSGGDDARREAETRMAGLTPRERDVLLGVAAGKSNKVIALELDISPRTVEVYRANLMTKTGARSIADLMRLAMAVGL
jgi:two-component system response regulator FixJ